MTKIAEAFAKTSLRAVSYQEIAQLGVTEIRIANLDEEIYKLEDGKLFKRGSIPCAKGAVVNITVFGERKYLQKISKSSAFKAYASITKKTIANGNVREFHNLDLNLVNPNTITYCKIKVVQQVSRNDIGRERKNPQGGAIVCIMY